MSAAVDGAAASTPSVPEKSSPAKAENDNNAETKPEVANTKNSSSTEVQKIKPDAAARMDEIMKRIADQVEYYLSDFNLSQDKFFRDLVLTDEGYVPVDTIMKCNRVKKITSNPVDVIDSLKKFSELEVDETGKRVKRKYPYLEDTEDLRAERDPRTVYVKRFTKTATMDAMQEYFRKFGPIDGLILQKFSEGDAKVKGKWKGSVLCIFKNKADAEKYMAASEEETKFGTQEMMREWKADHAASREKRMVDKKKDIEESKIPGSVLHLSTQRNIQYLPIKEYFEKLSPVRYIDHQKGQREVRVRFQTAVAKEILNTILSQNKNKIMIDGIHYKGRVLEGKEEEAYFSTYWDTFLEAKNNRILRTMRADAKQQFKFNPSQKNGNVKYGKPQDTGKDGENTTDVKPEPEAAKDGSSAEEVKKEFEDTANGVNYPCSHPAVGLDEVELKHAHDAASKKRAAEDEDSADSKKVKSDGEANGVVH
ncbi:hypothetical protein RvY_13162 [Ramazzottius varieornatus]|uniref:HTH La-type RNA-binding domain-containing protein n=1 Tax=Ramazzottius varieornatus TaxID=947166 RepID=A0A1D1VNU6_RAMVA|nr:hypothetical protein RvY_13162 [Ramazzottius varieornatus]